MTTYFVTDIETNGPYPGVHSILGFASVACREGEGTVGEFQINLNPLDEMTEHDDVMAWWQTQPEAYAYVTNDPSPPHDAITQWVDWVEGFDGMRAFAAFALIFDGPWIDWYLRRFADRPLFCGPLIGERLFDGVGLDLPSLAAGVLNKPAHEINASSFPKDWFGTIPHSHRAIDDARGYTNLLLHLLKMESENSA